MTGDFIPHQDGAFLEWEKTLLAYVSMKLTAFNIPAEAFTFDEPERGKALYICPGGKIAKGIRDPGGEIVKAIIP
jgi:hypothetical protein